jgi:peptidoglycan hydrolase-like protein with peptidoglycan-binding domain
VLIQLILSALAVVYDDFEDIVISGVNDEDTRAALKRFQGYNGLEQTGVLDKRTWDAAAKSFNAYYNNHRYTA